VKHVKFHLNRFLRRVRIHGGEFDTSARAMYRVSAKSRLMSYEKAFNTRAELRIVRRSTIERKQMSTKTTFKRIALVTVAALSFGTMAAIAPASAALAGNVALFCDVAATSGADSGGGARNTSTNTTCSGIAGPANSLKLSVNTREYVDGVSDTTAAKAAFVEITGGTILGTATTIDSGTVINTSRTQLTVVESGTVGLSIATPAVGTITVKLYKAAAGGYSATASETVVITVNAAAVAGTLSVANSKSIIDSGTAASAASSDEKVTGSGTSTNANKRYAVITVSLKDTQATPAAITASTVVSASITGAGLLEKHNTSGLTRSVITSGEAAGATAARVASVTTTTGTAIFNVVSDGTSGIGTITISAGSTQISTETITFYGTAATLSATQVLKVANITGTTLGADTADNSTDSPAIIISAKDSAGNPVVGLTTTDFSAATSDALVMSKTIVVTADTVTPGDYNVKVTSAANSTSAGKSATLTVSYKVSSTVTITAPAVTFTLGGGSVYGVTMTADKTSYAPGELVTLTMTAKDKYGNAVADGSYALFDTSSAGTALVPSASLTSKPFGTTGSVSFVGGVKTATLYAPYGTGALTITGTFNTSVATTTAKTSVVGTVQVVDAGSSSAQAAAEEATAAANDATDAALSAAEAAEAATAMAQEAVDAVAELSAQVTSLISALRAQITALTNLVVKIQKKVKA